MVRKVFFFLLAACSGFMCFGSLLLLVDSDYGNPGEAMGFLVVFALLTALFVWLALKPKKKKRDSAEAYEEQRRRAEAAMQATEIPVVPAPLAIVLKEGEICHFQRAASVLIVKNEVVGRTGGYGGVSIRVARGVTLHSGRTAGRTIRDDVAHTYPGIFSMTSSRFIMTGEKGFEKPIDKLTSCVPYGNMDGITLQFGRSVYTLLMEDNFWVPKILELMASGAPVCLRDGGQG